MDRLLSIDEASKILGVSVSTMRRWEREGKLFPSERTEGNQRRYRLSSLRPGVLKESHDRVTLAYARVSSRDQIGDLERQKKVLESFCASNGWTFEIISDLGSGMNYNKKGLLSLLKKILNGDVSRIVVTDKDRLLRFGSDLVFSICEMMNTEVVIINKGIESTFEEDLAKDVLEIITVFSARLYGSRSHKNKKLIEELREAVKDAEIA